MILLVVSGVHRTILVSSEAVNYAIAQDSTLCPCRYLCGVLFQLPETVKTLQNLDEFIKGDVKF